MPMVGMVSYSEIRRAIFAGTASNSSMKQPASSMASALSPPSRDEGAGRERKAQSEAREQQKCGGFVDEAVRQRPQDQRSDQYHGPAADDRSCRRHVPPREDEGSEREDGTERHRPPQPDPPRRGAQRGPPVLLGKMATDRQSVERQHQHEGHEQGQLGKPCGGHVLFPGAL